MKSATSLEPGVSKTAIAKLTGMVDVPRSYRRQPPALDVDDPPRVAPKTFTRRSPESTASPGGTPQGPIRGHSVNFPRADSPNEGLRVPSPAVHQRRHGARRGDHAFAVGRTACRDAGQPHADPVGGRRGRVDGGHPAEPRPARGARAATDGVPVHGEPRAAGAADLHHRLGHHPAAALPGARPGRDARVLPDHRRPATCAASSTCSTRGASRRAQCRSRPRRRRWRAWWNRPDTPSRSAAHTP